ncbi:MAG: hypothetical protein NTY19_19795 [Planctomycetota bacterium]|nr:hypothetical protein [Planctomycetota bacterium]
MTKQIQPHPAEFYGKLLVRALDRREDVEKEQAEEKKDMDGGMESRRDMARRATGFEV